MLNKIKNKRIVIALLILGIGIGFAALTQTLDLFGTANLKGNTWDIHWEDAYLDDSSAGKEEPVISNDKLSVTYTADLDLPGDSYTFYVDAVNTGTIDGMVKTISNTIVNGETSTLPSYIKYTVTYEDGTAVAAKQLLPSNSSITYKVTVTYDKTAVTKENLQEEDSSLTFTFTVNYEQADSTAVSMNIKPTLCSANRNVEVPAGTVCKRASKLNYEVCKRDSSNGCKGSGYSYNEWVIYGTCGTQGEQPVAGDAFDCDVDGNGTFDADERFYYVSDSGSNEGYATLIYYKNVGEAGYYSSYSNYFGPVRLLNTLPSTSEWSNAGLNTNMTRQIKNELGTNTSNNGSYTLPNYTYTSRAARLLTAQEVNSACGITAGSYTNGELDTCQYLLENTTYATNTGTEYWLLETPFASNYNSVWSVKAGDRRVNDSNAINTRGVRPAIEVDKTKIAY